MLSYHRKVKGGGRGGRLSNALSFSRHSLISMMRFFSFIAWVILRVFFLFLLITIFSSGKWQEGLVFVGFILLFLYIFKGII